MTRVHVVPAVRPRRRAGGAWLRRLLVTAVVSLVAAGCGAGQGVEATSGSFTFVSPGGKTRFFYPPGTRGTIGKLSGRSVRNSERTIALEDYRGQVVVLNLWASWCGPCRSEADNLSHMAAETADDGVRLLGINVRDSRFAAEDFLRNTSTPYPSIHDPSGRVALALHGLPLSTIPITIVLDRQHAVAAIYLGSIEGTDVLSVIERVANEG